MEESTTMKIIIQSVPPHLIRSNQSGDWSYTEDSILALVDEGLPPESQVAIGIHEVIEAWRCREREITDREVCAFDDQYEAERKEGKHNPNDEPGDDPAAPYRGQHMDATHAERAVCHALGITWQEHERAVQQLEEDHPKIESPARSPSELSEPPPKHVLD